MHPDESCIDRATTLITLPVEKTGYDCTGLPIITITPNLNIDIFFNPLPSAWGRQEFRNLSNVESAFWLEGLVLSQVVIINGLNIAPHAWLQGLRLYTPVKLPIRCPLSEALKIVTIIVHNCGSIELWNWGNGTVICRCHIVTALWHIITNITINLWNPTLVRRGGRDNHLTNWRYGRFFFNLWCAVVVSALVVDEVQHSDYAFIPYLMVEQRPDSYVTVQNHFT